MIDFMKLLNNDTSNLNTEESEYAKKFTESLQEKIIDELIIHEADRLIEELNKDKEDFIESISQIYINGIKGYSKMNIQMLINLYLEKEGSEKFISLLESI